MKEGLGDWTQCYVTTRLPVEVGKKKMARMAHSICLLITPRLLAHTHAHIIHGSVKVNRCLTGLEVVLEIIIFYYAVNNTVKCIDMLKKCIIIILSLLIFTSVYEQMLKKNRNKLVFNAYYRTRVVVCVRSTVRDLALSCRQIDQLIDLITGCFPAKL